jgi:hypothetical protein
MIERGGIHGVESEDGPCPSGQHIPPFVGCLWCQAPFKNTLTFEMHQYVGCNHGRVCCWRCRKEFSSKFALASHYQIHDEEEISEERLRNPLVPQHVTELDVFMQHRREGASNRWAFYDLGEDPPSGPRRHSYDWEEGMFYTSPDLATGERGLCTE